MNLKRFSILVGSVVLTGIAVGVLLVASGLFAMLPLVYGAIAGGFVSATALMGFWAYLTLNFIVRGMIPWRLWVWIQMLLIGWVFVDLGYLRFLNEAGQAGGLPVYFLYALWPLAWAVLVGYLKARQSGQASFVPAVFFMYVFTVIEWYVALKSDFTHLVTIIGIVLLACNTTIILLYAKLLQPSPQR